MESTSLGDELCRFGPEQGVCRRTHFNQCVAGNRRRLPTIRGPLIVAFDNNGDAHADGQANCRRSDTAISLLEKRDEGGLINFWFFDERRIRVEPRSDAHRSPSLSAEVAPANEGEIGDGEEHGSAVLIAMTTHPTSLIGAHVRLDLLTVGDAAAIDAASTGSRETFLYAPVPGADPALPGARDGHAAIAERLSTYAAGMWIPFVQRRMSDGAVVGMTNYIAIGERLTGETAPSGVEIGGTWLSPAAQRSPINTEAKLLLLRFAFEEWKVFRLQIKTDERNERSRSAILRLGATFEGILRNFQPGSGDVGYGSPRNTAMYSIIDTEWPSVKTRLEAYLA